MPLTNAILPYDPHWVQHYNGEKRALSSLLDGGMAEYLAGKASFIQLVLERAKMRGYASTWST